MTRRTLAITALLLSTVITSVSGAKPAAANDRCLNVREQRAAILSGEVVRPSVVRRSVGGEVLRLALCTHDDALVWRVVVLKHNGRVSDHLVNASDGELIQ